MYKLVIIGAGGHGNVIADIAEMLGYSFIFWVDDMRLVKNFNIVVHKRTLHIPPNSRIIIGIGNNQIREQISKQYVEGCFINIFHNNSYISKSVKIGIGSVIMAGVSINSRATIGKHCILNTGCVVEHDCVIEDYVHLSPRSTICGNVTIGKSTWVGAGATVIQGIRIGDNVIIGAGAVIISDIPDCATVVGNPGRIVKFSQYYEV